MTEFMVEHVPLKMVVPTRLSERDFEALCDRARAEKTNPTVLVRTAIREYLISKKPPVAKVS